MATSRKNSDKNKGIEVLPIIEELQNSPEIIIPIFQLQDEKNVLQSKSFKRGGVTYDSPSALLQPVLNSFYNFPSLELTLTGENENTNVNADGSENTSFGRLNLVSKFEIDDNVFYEVGLLAALDLGTPVIKIYRGAKVRACLNLCIFSSEDTVSFKLADGINHELVGAYLASVVAKIQEAKDIIQGLKGVLIAPELLPQIIGGIVLDSSKKEATNGTNSVLNGIRLLLDSKSKYYHLQNGFNAWDLFNAFTEYFAPKCSVFDIPEKTRDMYKILRANIPTAQISLN